MFKSTNLRLNYPRSRTRYDERILKYHGINFFSIEDDDDLNDAQRKYDATLEYRGDGNYAVYGEDTPTRHFNSLDACLHYIVGGEFGDWRANWCNCGINGL